jgi:DNA-binding XRE family transcriptional regulator
MADLPADAKERIAAARRAAERKLKRDLKPLENTEDVLACAPVFAKFLRALFRSEAKERLTNAEANGLLTNAGDEERFDAQLEALLARTIEEGMSEATLAAQRASGADTRAPNVRLDVATKTLWEVGADGVERLASDPAYSEHNLWELLMPPGVKYRVRSSLFPKTNAAVQAKLESELRKEKTYGMGQFREWAAARRGAEADAARMPLPEASAPAPEESHAAAAGDDGAPMPVTIPEPKLTRLQQLRAPADQPAEPPPSPAPAPPESPAEPPQPHHFEGKRKTVRARATVIVDGAKLKSLRLRVGLTQEKLAELAGVVTSTIARAERRNGWRWELRHFGWVAGALNKASEGELKITAEDLQSKKTSHD